MTDIRVPEDPPPAPVFVPQFCDPSRRGLLLAAAILASAMGFIDSTVVAIAIPAIRASLDATLGQAQWVHNAYMLTLAALILVGGAMGDRFGLARVFGAGIALFILASLACAAAPTPAILVLSRAVQGIGAAIMVPGSLAAIARAYPREQRGRAIGIWAAASSLTTALGPVIGGLALTIGGDEMWRWVFAVNLPLGACALWLLRRAVQSDPGRPGTPVDLTGAALATGALFCLAWGLTGSHGPDPRWLAAGLAGLAAFILVEWRSAHPMMPLPLFRNPGFAATNLLTFLLYAAMGIVFFYLPMTLVAGWGHPEIDASIAFAPMSVFISILSARMGALADRTGPAPLLAVGSVCVAAGYAVMALITPAQAFWDGVMPAMCLVGFGMSLVVSPLSTAVMGMVEESESGLASGINNAATRLAGLIAVAATGGIAASAYTASGGPAGFGEISDLPGHGAAMSAGFARLCWLAAGLALISGAIAWVALRRPAEMKKPRT